MRPIAFAILLSLAGAMDTAAEEAAQRRSEPTKHAGRSYMIRLEMHELVGEGESVEEKEQHCIGALNVRVAEDVEGEFIQGALATVGSEQVKYGTIVKVRAKEAADGQVLVSGVLDVSNTWVPTDDGVIARSNTSLHFSRTIKLGETIRLNMPKEPTTMPWLVLRVERFDESPLVDTAPATGLASDERYTRAAKTATKKPAPVTARRRRRYLER